MKSRYQPMLSRSADGPFNGDAWYFEIKWDGVRAIAYVDDELSIRSRNDRELAGQFPELAELLSLAPHTVLDGEIVVMSGGKPDIQSLLPRLQTGTARSAPVEIKNPVTYIVFDILEKDKKPLIDLPFSERRKILEKSVTEGSHVILSVPVEARGEDYYKAAIAKGLEGVMAKRKDSLYESGMRSGTWLKIKAQRTCDCVIAGYTLGQGGRSPTFGALILGLYEQGGGNLSPVENGIPSLKAKSSVSLLTGDKNRRLVYIGKVGTGFSDRDLADLLKIFLPLKTRTSQLTGFEQAEPAIWLEPALVCEVAYQAVTRDKRLRIPRFIRIRSDRRPEECSTDQLAEVQVASSHTDSVAVDKDHSSGGRGISPVVRSRKAESTQGDQPPNPQKEQALEDYTKKRDFSVTSEPEGLANIKGEGNYFVIQEHHAHRLHYDLRLEREGVLKSWAVPKGMPEVPGEKHLAVAVEDHPLDYGHFEGTIPEGEYGAGTVSIWDNGTYDTKHWDPDKIEITFHGHRMTGPYVLVRFKRAGKAEWLIFRAEG
ncbi:MAG: DNA polymerase ligase N-terminal domain-containing protein [Methanoregula sp.]